MPCSLEDFRGVWGFGRKIAELSTPLMIEQTHMRCLMRRAHVHTEAGTVRLAACGGLGPRIYLLVGSWVVICWGVGFKVLGLRGVG